MEKSYTYVTMALSPEAYQEIRGKMLAAGYQHAIDRDGAVDMHGIAVIEDEHARLAPMPANCTLIDNRYVLELMRNELIQRNLSD